VNRTTGATLMNAASSRSHAVLTVFLERRVAEGAVSGQEPAGPGDRPRRKLVPRTQP
jgi:hypothetical protein